jgi:hypothetical protein
MAGSDIMDVPGHAADEGTELSLKAKTHRKCGLGEGCCKFCQLWIGVRNEGRGDGTVGTPTRM